MKRNNVVKLTVSFIGFVVVCGIALFAWYNFTGRGAGSEYGKGKSKNELMKEYINYAGLGDKFKAYRAIKAISDREPENMPLMRKAADAAVDAGKKKSANDMLQKVWKSGLRDPKVLFTLVSTSILPKYEQRKEALKLIAQINEEDLRKKLYALYYFQLEQYEKANEYFKWLAENDPHQVVFEYYARNLLSLRRPEDAQKVLEDGFEQGYLGAGGEIVLANLLAVQGLLGQENDLFDRFGEVYGQSDYVLLSHAIVLIANDKFEDAEAVLLKIDHPSRFAAKNITAPEEIIRKFKSDPMLKPLLQRLSSKSKKVIESENYDIFEMALFLDYIAEDFNRIAQEEATDEGDFLLEVSKIHDLFDAELSQLGDNFISHQARIFLSLILYHKADVEGLQKLMLYAAGKDRFYEGERDLYQYFIGKLQNDDDADNNLIKAKEILGRNVVVILAEAENRSEKGDYATAIKYYSQAAKLNRTLGSGVYLLEKLARALADDGKYLASFELIRRMHEKRIITKKTLLLLRDVAYPAGFPEISTGAQKVLEKKFGSSDDILIGGGELRLKEGDAQAALNVFEALLAKGIEPTYEARLNSVMAESMLQLQKYDDVLDIVAHKKVDDSFKARALYGLGRHDQALEIFSQLEGDLKETGQWRVEYGLLLALKKREEEAAVQFKAAIEDNPKLVRAYVELASLLLKHNQFEPAREYAMSALNLIDSLIRAKLIVANVDIVEGHDASAAVWLNEILDKYPTNIDALFLLSRSLHNQGEDAEALNIINRCLTIQPKQKLFLQQKIDILIAQGKLDEALVVAEMGIEFTAENASFEHAKVMLLLELQRKQDAYAAFRNIKNIQGSNRLLLESQVLTSLGKPQEALQKLKPYISSSKIGFRIIEVIINMQSDNLKDEQYIKDNIAKFKLNPHAFLVLGIMAEERGKYALAKLLYGHGLKSAPEELHLLNNYIWISLQLNDYDKAELLKKCTRALQLYPKNTKLIDTCCAAFNAFKMYDKTIETLRKNPVLMRLEPSLYLRLGEAWEQTGKITEAEKMYQEALRVKRSTPEIKTQAQQGLERLGK